MKAFWYHGLLICIATVVGGCVDPRSYMNLDVRLLADGYPPEYVEGYLAGFKSYCDERSTDKSNLLDNREAEANLKAKYCIGLNLEVKVEQDPKNSKSYQQGRDDGKIVASSSFLSYSQHMQERRDMQELLYDMKPSLIRTK